MARKIDLWHQEVEALEKELYSLESLADIFCEQLSSDWSVRLSPWDFLGELQARLFIEWDCPTNPTREDILNVCHKICLLLNASVDFTSDGERLHVSWPGRVYLKVNNPEYRIDCPIARAIADIKVTEEKVTQCVKA